MDVKLRLYHALSHLRTNDCGFLTRDNLELGNWYLIKTRIGNQPGIILVIDILPDTVANKFNQGLRSGQVILFMESDMCVSINFNTLFDRAYVVRKIDLKDLSVVFDIRKQRT